MRLRITEGIDQWNTTWRRKKHGQMTRARLAGMIGTDPARITDYDKGRKEPLVTRAIALSRALRMRLEDLVEE